MPDPNRLFLAPNQAKAAICADLRQYAPQKRLLRDLCPALLGRLTVADSGDDGAVWIETGKSGKMRKLTWAALCDRLCQAVAQSPPDLASMAAMVTRVFEAPASAGTGPGGTEGLWLETGMADFTCRLCGRCCRSLDYHDQCTAMDVHRWRQAGRNDLIARSRPVHRGGRIDHYRIWMSADGKYLRQTCPWLRPDGDGRFICAIQDHKPEICRQYPGSRKHARMTGCHGFGIPATPTRPAP